MCPHLIGLKPVTLTSQFMAAEMPQLSWLWPVKKKKLYHVFLQGELV